MAVERWVWANEISIFSYVEISAFFFTYGNGEFARTQISLRNDLRTAFVCRHLRLKYVYRCQARVAYYVTAQLQTHKKSHIRIFCNRPKYVIWVDQLKFLKFVLSERVIFSLPTVKIWRLKIKSKLRYKQFFWTMFFRTGAGKWKADRGIREPFVASSFKLQALTQFLPQSANACFSTFFDFLYCSCIITQNLLDHGKSRIFLF